LKKEPVNRRPPESQRTGEDDLEARKAAIVKRAKALCFSLLPGRYDKRHDPRFGIALGYLNGLVNASGIGVWGIEDCDKIEREIKKWSLTGKMPYQIVERLGRKNE